MKTAVSLTCEQRSSIRGVRHSWSNIFTGFNRPTTPVTREIILCKYHLPEIKQRDGFHDLHLEMKNWARKSWRETMEKSWPEKESHPSRVNFNERFLWEKSCSCCPSQKSSRMLWSFLPKNSAHACSASVYSPLMHRENQRILALSKSANYLLYIKPSKSLFSCMRHIPEQILSSFPSTELQ